MRTAGTARGEPDISERRAGLERIVEVLRVLSRLGFGAEKKSYAATYRCVQEAASREIRADCDGLIAAHLLLRRHGQTLCKASVPLCDRCPLRHHCRYFRSHPRHHDKVGPARPAAGRWSAGPH